MGFYRSILIFVTFTLVLGAGCSSSSEILPEDASSPPEVANTFALPLPSGTFAVGLKRYWIKDKKRNDPFLNHPHPRELTLSLYYPADPSTSQKELPYLDERLLKYYPDLRASNGPLNRVFMGVLKDPAVSKINPTYPVIVFSPAGEETPELYLGTIKELVSQGFVVAAIHHTYCARVTVFPNGSAKFREPFNRNLFERIRRKGGDAYGAMVRIDSEDIMSSVDALKTLDIHDRLDLNRLGMLGHAMGGMAVTHLCLHLKSCKAGVNMDGALLGGPFSPLHSGKLTGDLNKPFLFVVGKGILTAPAEKLKRKELIATLGKLDPTLGLEEYYQFKRDRWEGRVARALKRMGSNSRVIVFKKSEPNSFSDRGLLEAYSSGEQDPAKVAQTMKQVNTVLANFFKQQLQSKDVSLLSGLGGQTGFGLNLYEP